MTCQARLRDVCAGRVGVSVPVDITLLLGASGTQSRQTP
jgi:hypothetical protein